ncbi:succinate dehydrogenase assembly factor 2 [Rhizophlyctis rosea]|nr:succinate dehydrogenase assembly factor 2 [Rhizophlyctis rosea]
MRAFYLARTPQPSLRTTRFTRTFLQTPAIRLASSSNPTPPPPPPPRGQELGGPPPTPPQSDPLAHAVSLPPLPQRPIRNNESSQTKRARLLYNSRKRGILETDLILSTYAAKRLDKMSDKELEEFDKLMEENDWDIYYWVTGGKVPPERVREMDIFEGLVEHAKNKEKKGLRMPDLNA